MRAQKRVWTPMELIKVSADYLAERGVPSPRLDAELLLAHVLHMDRLQLYLDHARPLIPDELDRYRALLRERGQRVPLQLLVGEVQILDHSFMVQAGVFIPRPETEVLIRVCHERPFGPDGPARIVEVGSGTGCIGLSLLAHWPRAQLIAFDRSVPAVELSRKNAERLGVGDRLEAIRADALASSLPSCDLLVSNPPYVPAALIDELEPEVRDHDPREALDGGADGLDFIRALTPRATVALQPGGWIALEHGDDQGESVAAILRENGFDEVEGFLDLSERPRVTVGQRTAAVSGEPGRSDD